MEMKKKEYIFWSQSLSFPTGLAQGLELLENAGEPITGAKTLEHSGRRLTRKYPEVAVKASVGYESALLEARPEHVNDN